MLSFFVFLSLILCLILFFSNSLRRIFFSFISNYLSIFVVLLLVVLIVIYPKESVNAAYVGLMTWFTVVLPALLPFFIGAELLIGLGVVKFIGILLEPLMRPLFNVPGEGSFAFAMSITSGYPVGAKIVSKLRDDKILTSIEAQRLAAFSSTSGPLFIMGAVGVGMFKSPEIGWFLAICHYLGAISVGVLFSFYKSTKRNIIKSNKNYLLSAFSELKKARKKSPSLGVLLGKAVKESVNTMLMVGGFIIMFSVIINILELIGFIHFVTEILLFLFKPFDFNYSLIKGLIISIFEITIGCKEVAEAGSVYTVSKIAIASFAIAWSGFSIHAQAISILTSTDFKTGIYIFSKLIQGIFSLVFVYLLFPVFNRLVNPIKPVFVYNEDLFLPYRIFESFKISIELFIGIVLFLLVISLFVSLYQYIKGCLHKG